MEEPIASMCICNTCSIVILDIVYGINDYVLTAFIIDDIYIYNKTTRIFYDYNNRPYFYRFRVKYYLDEFMKI